MTVYLFSDGDCLKIGFTTGDVYRRARALQTGSSHDITVVQYVPGATVEDERSLHRQFAHYRVRGEWFADVQEIRVEFERFRAAVQAEYREEIRRRAQIATHPQRAIFNSAIINGGLAVAGAVVLHQWVDSLGWDIVAGIVAFYFIPVFYRRVREVRELARDAEIHVAAAEEILGPNWAGGARGEGGR